MEDTIMKIEIDIDITAIVTEVIRETVRENLVINNVPVIDVAPKTPNPTRRNIEETIEPVSEAAEANPERFIGKYDETKWKRRSPLKRALNEEEIRLGRYLTADEEAAVEAKFELDQDHKTELKEQVKQKVQNDQLAEELTKEVTEEAEAATEETSEVENTDTKEDTEALSIGDALSAAGVGDSVPEADDLDHVKSRFA